MNEEQMSFGALRRLWAALGKQGPCVMSPVKLTPEERDVLKAKWAEQWAGLPESERRKPLATFAAFAGLLRALRGDGEVRR